MMLRQNGETHLKRRRDLMGRRKKMLKRISEGIMSLLMLLLVCLLGKASLGQVFNLMAPMLDQWPYMHASVCVYIHIY